MINPYFCIAIFIMNFQKRFAKRPITLEIFIQKIAKRDKSP